MWGYHVYLEVMIKTTTSKKRIKKRMKRNLEIWAAALEMFVKPNTPVISAMTKKIKAHFNIHTHLII
jgi:hypothetical protein